MSRNPLPSIRSRPKAAWPTRCLGTALAVALVSASAPADAAKIYRCGNAFQDQPCSDPKPATAPPTDRAPATKEAPACPENKDAVGRADRALCAARSTRDGQAVVAADTRR